MIRTGPIIVSLLLLHLAGCAGVAPPPERARPAATPGEAAAAFEQAEYGRAARLYEALAETAPAGERDRYRLQAARAYLREGRLQEAAAAMDRINPEALTETDRMALQLLRAEGALLRGQPHQVLERLRRPQAGEAATALHARYHDLRARALTRLGRPDEAAQEHVLRERFLTDPRAVRDNRDALWNALSLLTPGRLDWLADNAAPPLNGWVELARIARALPREPEAAAARLSRWQAQHPDHPATERILDKVLEQRRRIAGVSRLALLLPLSGRFQQAGEAVRDGVLAAYYDSPGQTLEVQVYDTGGTPARALLAYDRAVAAEAGFVIGPLRKESVRALAGRSQLPVPVLALNDLPATVTAPPRFYRFALAPEGEARQVAERAWADGFRRAALFLPRGDWGERLRDAFQARWDALGGHVVAVQDYNPEGSDFSSSIRHMLNLDQSRVRHRRVVRMVGRGMEFEPRRRQDIDLIFLGAFPAKARLIRPQLRFHHATRLPVYATSHVFAGDADPERDRDMDGVVFADMPWTLGGETPHRPLRQRNAPQLAVHASRWQRLVAFGVDGYHLIRHLEALGDSPGARFAGETGRLWVDASGEVHRELLWARFDDGEPELLPPRRPEGTGGDAPGTTR